MSPYKTGVYADSINSSLIDGRKRGPSLYSTHFPAEVWLVGSSCVPPLAKSFA